MLSSKKLSRDFVTSERKLFAASLLNDLAVSERSIIPRFPLPVALAEINQQCERVAAINYTCETAKAAKVNRPRLDAGGIGAGGG